MIHSRLSDTHTPASTSCTPVPSLWITIPCALINVEIQDWPPFSETELITCAADQLTISLSLVGSRKSRGNDGLGREAPLHPHW